MVRLIIVLQFVILINAYSQYSYLQLSLYDDGYFSAELNNISLTKGNFAEFDSIKAGEHRLKVYKIDDENGGAVNLIYDNTIKIQANSDIYAVIDEYNSFLVYKRKKYNMDRLYPSGENVIKCGSEGKIENKNVNIIIIDECKYKAIKSEDFNDLKKSINNRNFESKNITIIKEAIDKNYFKSEQIKELLGYFTFEDTKLEIAKYSYKKICDVKNFHIVYDAFNFETSVTELKNFISKK
jgi:hypothetical protein